MVVIFYRGGGDSNLIRGMTAQDIVDYEIKELGNILELKSDIDLSLVRSENVRWFTESKESAIQYGEISKVMVMNYRILARDNDGGILVEFMD